MFGVRRIAISQSECVGKNTSTSERRRFPIARSRQRPKVVSRRPTSNAQTSKETPRKPSRAREHASAISIVRHPISAGQYSGFISASRCPLDGMRLANSRQRLPRPIMLGTARMMTPPSDWKCQSVIAKMDAWRAAGVLISEYGEDAELIAVQRADVLFDADEVVGYPSSYLPLRGGVHA